MDYNPKDIFTLMRSSFTIFYPPQIARARAVCEDWDMNKRLLALTLALSLLPVAGTVSARGRHGGKIL